MVNFDFYKIPSFYGCDNLGVDKAPDKIIRKLSKFLTNQDRFHYSISDIFVQHIQENSKFLANKNFKYFDSIYNYSSELSKKVHTSINSGSTPVCIGGDHSIAIGSLSGSINSNKNIQVIWIDAHGDINTIHTTPSQNGHGMVLSNAIGISDCTLTNLYKKFITPSNITYFGIRDLDPYEDEFIKRNGIEKYTSDELNSDLDRILTNINLKNKNIHLSFDIDSLDPQISPGTGLRVPNGIKVDTAKRIMKYLIHNNNIVAFDFVEYNPRYDKDDVSLNIICDLIQFCMEEYLERQFNF